MSPRYERGVPVLVVSDLARAVEYYCQALGFEPVFEYGDPVYYAAVRRDTVEIHLQAAGDAKRTTGGSGFYVFVDDADAVHADLEARGAKITKAPATYAYGMRDFNVEDLDGNELYFGSAA